MGNQCCPSSPATQTMLIQKNQCINQILQFKQSPSAQIKSPQVNSPNMIISQKSQQVQQQRIIELPDGSKYTGMTKQGIPNGKGTQTHQTGDQYIGNFILGIKQGYGIYNYANGTIYQGEFKQGQMNGNGKIKWNNGDWYEGSFKNNIINGFGKYYSKQNDSYYQGTYLNGKRHGRGKITTDGSVLQGFWEFGQFKYRKPVSYQL